jgi:hypothetical protein
MARIGEDRLIGIGGRLAASALPHHRAYGSVPRQFDRVKLEQEHRGGEDRGRRNTGCAGPVGPPDVRTCARTRLALGSRQSLDGERVLDKEVEPRAHLMSDEWKAFVAVG